MPLTRVPDLVTRGEVRGADAVAALMLLHHLRVTRWTGCGRCGAR
ncbi:hypothetical protein [Streptomyces ziwulingensis]